MSAKIGIDTITRFGLAAAAVGTAWWALSPQDRTTVAAQSETTEGEKKTRLKSTPTGGDMSFFMGTASNADSAHLSREGGKPL
mmetsp:Transcript_16556/g.52653  ORF Transcript_16556/g.52653 Transcript_16556/m.52653 type:complete len:83 (+) Transcript_16556:264-512(+)